MSDRTERSISLAVLILSGVLLVVVAVPYLQLPFAGEHGIYAFDAWRMQQGDVPYRDFWNMNTPAVFMVHSIADLLFGHSMRSIRAFDVVWVLATWVFLYRVTRRLFGSLAASLAVLFATATYFTLGHQSTAQRDFWCLLPLLAMLDGVACAPATRRGDLQAAALVGLASALAFWLKPPFLLPSAVCALALLRRRSAPIAANLGVAAVAFLLPAALVFLYFWHENALTDLYENTVLFNAQYTLDRYPIGKQLWVFAQIAIADPLLIVGVAGFVATLRRPGVVHFAGVVLACLLVVIVQGKLYPYQVVPVRLLLCVGAAALAAALWQAQRSPIGARAAAVAIVALAGWSFANAFESEQYPAVWLQLLRGGVAVRRDELSLAAFLQARTRPTDTVLIWGVGTSGAVHYLSQRNSPTRFTLSYPFSLQHADTPLIQRWRQEFITALERKPPRAVVVASGDAWESLKNVDSSVSFERFTVLHDFVTQHYHPIANMKGRLEYQIFWLNEPEPPAATPPQSPGETR